MKRLLPLLPVLAFLFSIPPSATAEPLVFQIDMYGENVVPPVDTHAWGFVRFFFDDDRSHVNYTVDIKGHSGSAVTGAAIRQGAPGENGPIVVELAGPDFIVTSGRLTLTSEQVEAFASGGWYVTLSTTFHPEGEIRGQITVPEGFLPGQSASRAPTRAPQAPSGSPGTIRPPDTGDAGLR